MLADNRSGNAPDTGQNDRLLSLRKTASWIMHDAVRHAENLAATFSRITRGSAESLGVARVGIWLFDESGDNLVCADLFDARHVEHSNFMRMSCADYPAYIRAITADQLVAVDDVYRDAVTAELVSSYLTRLGVTSMLDAPIVREGKTIGVLCHEHIGAGRHWEAAELAFAETMADFVTLSIESIERRRSEAEKLRLASIIELTTDLVATVTPDGRPLYLNRAGRDLLGLLPDSSLDDFDVQDIYTEERWQQRQQVVIPHALEHGSWTGETEIITLAGERIPVMQSIIVHRDSHGAVTYLSSIIRDLRKQKRIENELRQREQSLQLLNRELERRVADRTRQLESVNQNLETFAFSVSHDLKAPLRGIDGYSKLLLDEYRAQVPEEAQLFIDNIRQATMQMQQLIDDLLAYSRVGRRELTTTRLSLRQLVDRILTELGHDLEQGGITVDDQVANVELQTDVDCMAQILRNLIDNAAKFVRGRQRPHITITSRIAADKVVLSVKDNGCGFDMKYHDRIFTIFQRLHRGDQYPGTGVGLAIVVKAAERIGGRVWAVAAPDEGAEFFVELPYGQ